MTDMGIPSNQAIARPRARWRRRISLWLSAILVTLVIAWLAISARVAWTATRRSRPPFVESPVGMPVRVEEHRLATADGQTLGAWFFRGSRPVSILLLHGRTGCRSNPDKLDLMIWLCQQDYSVMAISLRAHGDSTGEIDDFGYSSRNDVVAAVEFLRQRDADGRIVVVGHSLGSAAAIFAARDCAGKVDGYFLESPYRDLPTAVWNRCQNALWPPFSHIAYAGLRLWAPAFLPESPARISPIEHIGHIPGNVPVTILAGRDDRHSRLPEMQDLQARIGGHCTLVTLPGPHGFLQKMHRDEYRRAVGELIHRVEEHW